MSKRRKIRGLAPASENREAIDQRIAEIKRLGVKPRSTDEVIEAAILIGSSAYSDYTQADVERFNAFGFALLWALGLKGPACEDPLQELIDHIKVQNGLHLSEPPQS